MLTPKKIAKSRANLSLAYRDYQGGLNNRAFFKVHDRALGKDLVQDTFIKTWAYLLKGGQINTMKAFLYHVLNCLIIDEYRKRKTLSLDSMLEKGFEPKATTSERLFDILDGKNLMLLIDKLPTNYQKVIRMRYTQDLSLTEIALITKKTKNNIAVRLHRGLAKLKLLYNRSQSKS